MTHWTLEPGHTAAQFSVRHMMVTYVRGQFSNVQGTVEFDPTAPERLAVDATIDASTLWSGDADRDAHLKNEDFLDVANHPHIRFKGDSAQMLGKHDYLLAGDLTIRGVTRRAELEVTFLGTWETPWWEDGEDRGPKTRAGFLMRTNLNRRDFGLNWNGELEGGGVVIGDNVGITIDAEAIAD